MRLRVLIFFVAMSAFFLGALGGIWAQAFLMPYLAFQDPFEEWKFVQDWSEKTTVIREVREVVIQLDDATERVAARAESMVVGIESRGSGRVITGAGFSVFEDGFILTLASIVPQGYETRVYLGSGEEFVLAEVIKRDFQQDLAVLKIEKRNLQTAGFASDDSIRLGDPVVMVAKSLEDGELITIVNQGSVRTIDENVVRTNIIDKAALSGSPLLNLEGNIVGLSTFEPSGRLVAIPASVLRAFSGF